MTFRNARDRTRERSRVGGHRHCAHDHLMRPSQTLLLLGNSSGCAEEYVQASRKSLGTYSSGHSAAIGPPGATGRHAVGVGGKRREEVLYMDTRGIQAVTWAMLLLYDQDCKAWCHDGHETAI